jgi:hypothetical protein
VKGGTYDKKFLLPTPATLRKETRKHAHGVAIIVFARIRLLTFNQGKTVVTVTNGIRGFPTQSLWEAQKHAGLRVTSHLLSWVLYTEGRVRPTYESATYCPILTEKGGGGRRGTCGQILVKFFGIKFHENPFNHSQAVSRVLVFFSRFGRTAFDTRQDKRCFLSSRLTPQSTQLPLPWILYAISSARRLITRLHLQIKNAWIFTSTLPIFLHYVVVMQK